MMRWDAHIFPGEKQKDKSFYTLSSQQPFTFFIWNTNKTEMHDHKNYVEIFIVLKGKINHCINGETTTMRQNDAYIIPPNVGHQLLPFDKDETCRYVNITCSSEKVALLLKTLWDLDFSIIQCCSLKLAKTQSLAVDNYIEQILAAQYKENDHLPLSSFFTYMLSCFLLHPTPSISVEKNSKTLPSWLEKFLVKLSEMDLETIEICNLYKLSSYSQSALSIQFKKHMNMTLVQYINKLKMDYANNLLSRTNFSIRYIAGKIGYLNLGHFNRTFKKFFGFTPSGYRKIIQKNN